MINHIYTGVHTLFFSPTGTTAVITKYMGEMLAHALHNYYGQRPSYHVWDFTLPDKRMQNLGFTRGDIVVVGLPVYAGRVPNLLLPFLNSIRGNGATAIPVVLFGNRHFDDALIELHDILAQNQFHIIAAAAFVGQHSFSDTLAKGRPDKDDMVLAKQFVHQVVEKLKNITYPVPSLSIPGRGEGERVYYQPKDVQGNRIDIRKVKPVTGEKCNRCGICASVCPMGGIDQEVPSLVPGVCIKCCACIKKCPLHAKYFSDPGFLYHVHDLETTLQSKRGEVNLFV